MNKEKAMKYMKDMLAYTSASIIPLCLNLIANPFIASNMSPEDYAITGYFTSFNTLISPVILFYLIHYYTRSYFTTDGEKREVLKATIFKALIFFSFAIAAVCLFLIWGYIMVFDSSLRFPVFPYLMMTVFTIPLTGIYTLELTDCKMSRRSRSFFRMSVLNGCLMVGFNLLMVAGLKLGAFGRLLSPLLISGAFFIYLIIRHRNYFRLPFDIRYLKEILRFCLPLAASAMLGYFFNGFDKTFLESLGDVNEYGIYIVGAQMAGFLTTFSTAVSSTFQPDIYDAIARNDSRGFLKCAGIVTGIVACTAAVFIVFAPFVIDILTMGRYVASAPYARILAISTVTSTVYYTINNYTIARGLPKLYLYTTVLGSLGMVILLPVMAKAWSFTGAAAATVLSYVILSAINIILLKLKKR